MKSRKKLYFFGKVLYWFIKITGYGVPLVLGIYIGTKLSSIASPAGVACGIAILNQLANAKEYACSYVQYLEKLTKKFLISIILKMLIALE